ncbi:ABC transporter substrate-binding protein [Micromonospora sp. NPDC006431]|uniref:ABC transporter substrate-binding protein n=1 Tax=Micromonospora sp. NPDC006431 TaxID=3364235 RepID=UPI0036CC4E64
MNNVDLSRRSLLRLVGAGAAATAVGGLTSACNLIGGSEKSSGDKATIKVALTPDPSGASQFYRQQFDLFEQKNPGIKIEIIENPSLQQLNAVELMFQQGNPPDVFRAQDNGFDRMFERGWTASLDQYVTDEFTSRFPAGSLDPATSGLHRDGKLYTLPLVWGKWSSVRMLLVNNAILKQHGIAAVPKTWEELEQSATKITQAGGGKVFGFAAMWNQGDVIKMFQPTAGAWSIAELGVDLRTGKAAVTDPSLGRAVELLRRLHAGKVMMPGWETWTDTARIYTAFAKEQLAMYPASPFQVNEVRKLNAKIDMSIVPIPVPASGRTGYSGQRSNFSPLWSMSAQSKHPDQAWKVMDFLASKDFHLAYYEKFGTLTALESAWQDKAAANPDQQAIIDVAAEALRRGPNPILASAGGKELWNAITGKQDLKWADTAQQSILRNQPFAGPATQLNAKLDAFIDEQIKALSGKGITASRVDLTFPTWNPLEPYTPGQK